MNTIPDLSTALTYIICVTLMLWVVIMMRGRLLTKMLAVSASLYCVFCLCIAINSHFGWASNDCEQLPAVHEILSVRVHEPGQTSGDPGIYLLVCKGSHPEIDVEDEPNWLASMPVFSYWENENNPRLFRMEYTQDRHKQAAQVASRLKQGKRVVAMRPSTAQKMADEESGDEEMEEGKKGGAEGLRIEGESEFEYLELPAPQFPPKD